MIMLHRIITPILHRDTFLHWLWRSLVEKGDWQFPFAAVTGSMSHYMTYNSPDLFSSVLELGVRQGSHRAQVKVLADLGSFLGL